MWGDTESFAYDPAGNRMTGPDADEVYVYNTGNQLTSDGKRRYDYDRNGNLIRKTETDDDGEVKTRTYTYDYENRLIAVDTHEGEATEPRARR